MNDFRKIIESNKSFPEDYSQENGNYFNTCYKCKSTFCGYKRRVICKECTKELSVTFWGLAKWLNPKLKRITKL